MLVMYKTPYLVTGTHMNEKSSLRPRQGPIIEINFGSSKGQILLHFSKNENGILYLNIASILVMSVRSGFPQSWEGVL